MSDDEVAAVLKGEPGHRGAIDVGAVRQEVRAAMYATVDEMLIPGLRAVAVPILDIQGRVALVATAIATNAFSRQEDAAVRNRLQGVCKGLTERLGASWASS